MLYLLLQGGPVVKKCKQNGELAKANGFSGYSKQNGGASQSLLSQHKLSEGESTEVLKVQLEVCDLFCRFCNRCWDWNNISDWCVESWVSSFWAVYSYIKHSFIAGLRVHETQQHIYIWKIPLHLLFVLILCIACSPCLHFALII